MGKFSWEHDWISIDLRIFCLDSKLPSVDSIYIYIYLYLYILCTIIFIYIYVCTLRTSLYIHRIEDISIYVIYSHSYWILIVIWLIYIYIYILLKGPKWEHAWTCMCFEQLLGRQMISGSSALWRKRIASSLRRHTGFGDTGTVETIQQYT